MCICEVGVFEAEIASSSVHFLQEAIDCYDVRELALVPVNTQVLHTNTLETTHYATRTILRICLLILSGHLVKILSKVLCENLGCIVSAWKHEAVEEVPQGEDVAGLQISCGALNGCCEF